MSLLKALELGKSFGLQGKRTDHGYMGNEVEVAYSGLLRLLSVLY